VGREFQLFIQGIGFPHYQEFRFFIFILSPSTLHCVVSSGGHYIGNSLGVRAPEKASLGSHLGGC
jgi:hypothetical protein